MSQTAAATAIQSAVEEMQALMRADGADLVVKELNVPAARLHLVVDLANVECLDCVVPPDMLRQVIQDAITKKYAGELEILIDDPREA
ncbi:MAG: hypothetical protein IPK00_11295 [Deltaproteobacteria bacterium]|nr:hypothetical protein [Deltaproteobacteria bacterium]